MKMMRKPLLEINEVVKVFVLALEIQLGVQLVFTLRREPFIERHPPILVVIIPREGRCVHLVVSFVTEVSGTSAVRLQMNMLVIIKVVLLHVSLEFFSRDAAITVVVRILKLALGVRQGFVFTVKALDREVGFEFIPRDPIIFVSVVIGPVFVGVAVDNGLVQLLSVLKKSTVPLLVTLCRVLAFVHDLARAHRAVKRVT